MAKECHLLFWAVILVAKNWGSLNKEEREIGIRICNQHSLPQAARDLCKSSDLVGQ